MTRLVYQALESKENPQVLVDLHRICGEEGGSTWVPKSPQEIANRIFCVRTPSHYPRFHRIAQQQLIFYHLHRLRTWVWRRIVPRKLALALRLLYANTPKILSAKNQSFFYMCLSCLSNSAFRGISHESAY